MTGQVSNLMLQVQCHSGTIAWLEASNGWSGKGWQLPGVGWHWCSQDRIKGVVDVLADSTVRGCGLTLSHVAVYVRSCPVCSGTLDRSGAVS